jgi:biotin carboxylase
MPEAWLLLLGGAARSQGMRCVRQAQARGLRVLVADTPLNLTAAPEIAGAADATAAVDFADPAACIRWARAEPRAQRAIGVYGFREFSVESVAEVASALGLRGNPPEAVRVVRDKLRTRTALAAAGLAQPAAAACVDGEAAVRFTQQHPPGPWIVKPRAAMGARGVRLVATHEEARQAGAAAAEDGGDAWLIEELQQGDEYSAEGVFVDGAPLVAVLTEKRRFEGTFIAEGQVVPARLDAERAAAIRREAERGLAALGLSFGWFHVEARLDPARGVQLGELHVRPGGGWIHFLVELATGVEPYGSVFDELLGNGRLPTPAAGRAAAVRYFAPPPGRVRRVAGTDRAAADPACVRIVVDVAPGDTVPALCESTKVSGYVIARAPSPGAALAAAARLHDVVAIETESAS